jgi:hypothetical protein
MDDINTDHTRFFGQTLERGVRSEKGNFTEGIVLFRSRSIYGLVTATHAL